MGKGRLRIEAPTKHVVPLAERGRMMFVNDVFELLRGAKSKWWIRTSFATEYRQKLGRDPYWWECDVTKALDEGQGT